jgi:hypothetical protein
MKLSFRILVIVAGLVSHSVSANLITNGDFETIDTRTGLYNLKLLSELGDVSDVDGIYDNYDTYASLSGWETIFGSGIEVQHTSGAVATLLKTSADFSNNGNNYVELDTEPGSALTPPGSGNANSGMTQQISNLSIGQTYLFEFWYLSRTNFSDDNGINVFWYDDTQTYTNDYFGDTTDGDLFSVDFDNSNFNDWTKYSLELIATSNVMNIGLGAFGDYGIVGGNTMGGLIDNLSLVEVTEPSSLYLAIITLLGFSFRKFKISK